MQPALDPLIPRSEHINRRDDGHRPSVLVNERTAKGEIALRDTARIL